MVGEAGRLPEEARASAERNALLNALKHGGKADVGAVVGKVIGEFPELRSRAEEVAKEARAAVERINGLALSEQDSLLSSKYPGLETQAAKEERSGLPPLAGAVRGGAVFRLPPEPSGFMHIGHAMAFTINYLYKRMYSGELWLRFEDTNPRKVEERYYESFRRGIKWLAIEWDHEKNVSDDMEVMYERGRDLVSTGLAYACSCDPDKVKRLRFAGEECEHRDGAIERNQRVWDELLDRKHHEGDYVIRFKGDMQALDTSLRDPNIFRIIEQSHPITAQRYILWPTYDFANTVEDEVCGVTHILRSSEFHTGLQELIRKSLKFRPVEVVQFSRFNFKGTPVQKRLLRPLVQDGLVAGWDDPRMPTLDGIRRRGILPEAIRKFTETVGYTKTEHEYDWSLLFSVNRKLLDPTSKRLFFVPDPVSLKVTGAPRKTVSLRYHPEADLGSRTFETGDKFFVPREDIERVRKGGVFRLIGLFNVELTRAGRSPVGKHVGEELNRELPKLQWVVEPHQARKVMVPDVLFDEKGEFNRSSLREVDGLAEGSVSDLHEGEVVQFPRFGFCRVDSSTTLILAHK